MRSRRSSYRNYVNIFRIARPKVRVSSHSLLCVCVEHRTKNQNIQHTELCLTLAFTLIFMYRGSDSALLRAGFIIISITVAIRSLPQTHITSRAAKTVFLLVIYVEQKIHNEQLHVQHRQQRLANKQKTQLQNLPKQSPSPKCRTSHDRTRI